MVRSSIHRHMKTCKKVSKTTCSFCSKEFASNNSRNHHHRICKQRNVNTVIHNNNQSYTNSFNTTNNTFHIQFGSTECIEFIRELRQRDERLDTLQHNFNDLVDLLFFNKNREDNQTIRKSIKKSDLFELRYNDIWDAEPSSTVVPKFLQLLSKLANSAFNTNDKDFNVDVKVIKEFIYYKTKRGPLDETHILQKHDAPPMVTHSETWRRFVEGLVNEYAEYPMERSMFVGMKTEVLQDVKNKAVEFGLDNFYMYREGLQVFDTLLSSLVFIGEQ